MKDGAPSGVDEDFLTGFVADDAGVWGRPAGVAVTKDGALLVSDDEGGAISPTRAPDQRDRRGYLPAARMVVASAALGRLTSTLVFGRNAQRAAIRRRRGEQPDRSERQAPIARPP